MVQSATVTIMDNLERDEVLGVDRGLPPSPAAVEERQNHASQKSLSAKLVVPVIGESATDLVHTGMIAIELEGSINTLVDSVFNAPTLSEMYKAAAYDGLGNLAGHKLKEG